MPFRPIVGETQVSFMIPSSKCRGSLATLALISLFEFLFKGLQMVSTVLNRVADNLRAAGCSRKFLPRSAR